MSPHPSSAKSEAPPSHKKERFTLAIALLLLALSGIGASFAIVRLYLSEGWVRHTYAVEVALGDLESALAGVGTARIAYLDSPTSATLQEFNDATQKVPPAIARIRSLTRDNPGAQMLCGQLEENANRRVAVSVKSQQLVERNQSGSAQQMQLTAEVAGAAMATAAIEKEMRSGEDALLARRSQLTKRLFGALVGIVIISFTLSAVMFWIHNRILQRELRDRKTAENQLRQLSVQLLRVRDDEARRFARELHDGLGQSMIAAKLIAESLSSQNPSNPKFQELATLVQEATAQTRTISYLLHPPMLDELGFASAAEWFIEGFTQRTGVIVATRIAAGAAHLPKDLELALFRILQEALTNIHKHSKSAKAEVSVSIQSQEVTLIVNDYGRGIPPQTLSNFKSKGTHVGVGLAGMKERVMEFKGNLEIQSNGTGTRIVVTMPVTSRPDISAPSFA